MGGGAGSRAPSAVSGAALRLVGGSAEEHAVATSAMVEAVEAERTLRSVDDLTELRSRASVDACAFCGFDRAVVLAVSDGELRADGTAIDHGPSDVLRRRALGRPAVLAAGSAEAELVRGASSAGVTSSRRSDVLARALGLRHFVLAAVVPEDRAVAVLVLDRADGEVAEVDVMRAEVYAGIIGIAVERAVLRSRIAELAAEFRHLAVSALAMGEEALKAPVTLSTDHGWGAVFPRPPEARPRHVLPEAPPKALLSEREQAVLAFLAEGRSNREIAAEMHLSPDTVKGYVARVLRKLDASNRAEAVGRWLAMIRPPDA